MLMSSILLKMTLGSPHGDDQQQHHDHHAHDNQVEHDDRNGQDHNYENGHDHNHDRYGRPADRRQQPVQIWPAVWGLDY